MAAILIFGFFPYRTIVKVVSEDGGEIESLIYYRDGEALIQGADSEITLPKIIEESDELEVVSSSENYSFVPKFGPLSSHIWKEFYIESYISSEKTDISNSKRIVRYNYQILSMAKELNRTYQIMLQVVSMIADLILLVMVLLIRNMLFHVKKKDPIRRSSIVMRMVPSSMICLIGNLFLVGYRYLYANFPDTTLAQLVFHMQTNLEGADLSNFSALFRQLIYSSSVTLAICILSGLFLGYFIKNEKISLSAKWIAGCTVPLAIMTAGAGMSGVTFLQFIPNYKVIDYVTMQRLNTTLFEDYYVAPDSVDITASEHKNLIYIFAESMEITPSDIQNGGGRSYDCIPELTDLALENDCFNGKEQLLNGAVPLTNTTWTIAGMVAQTSGLPLAIDHSISNDGEIDSFMPGATSIGDILGADGYKNVLLLGSDAEFGNRAEYFMQHGNYEIDDYKWAIKQKLIPEDYYVWWGYEDAKLFEFAKMRASQLAEGSQPFNLTLLTADTHFYDGYLCQDCRDEYEEQYDNVLACSSRKISEFVKWVRDQPWGKDTVIVISGDHLYMDSEYYTSNMESGFERRTYVDIINSSKKEPDQYRKYSTFDLFPTTLSALGFEIPNGRLGFGTDLYGEHPTLLEEKGELYLNYQLSLKSDYFNQNIQKLPG